MARVSRKIKGQAPEQVPPLDAGALTHQNDHTVAQRGANHGERNAGIATGAFEDDGIRPQKSAFLGIEHDAMREAILDAAACYCASRAACSLRKATHFNRSSRVFSPRDSYSMVIAPLNPWRLSSASCSAA